MRSLAARFRPVLGTLRSSQGSMAVEFALIALVLITMIMGIIELGRVLWIRNSLQFAAEEAARYAMVHQLATNDEIVEFARSRITWLPGQPPGFEIIREAVNGISFVTIRATVLHGQETSLVPLGPLTLSGSSRVPLLE